MAIKKEDIEKIEETLRLEQGSLLAAIESEEEAAIELPALTIRTAEEEETYSNNIRSEAKTAGVEMAIKGVRNELGLDFQGKTMDNLLEAHKSKVLADAKAELGEPDKKITELSTDLEKLRKNYSDLENKNSELQMTMVQKDNERKIDTAILGLMPSNMTLSKEDALTLFKSKTEVELSEGGEIVYKRQGQQIKNPTTLEAVPGKSIIDEFVNPFLRKAEGGAGGNNNVGDPKAGTMDAFQKEMETKGLRAGSAEFNQELNKRISDGTLKV